MSSPRRLLAIACGLVVAGWALRAPADAPAAPTAPPAGVPVEVETADGSKVEGALELAALRVQTGHGAIDLDVRKVRRLTLATDDGRIAASAALTDKSHLDGRLLTPDLPVTVNGQTRRLNPADVRVVTFRQPKDASLAAAVLGLVTLSVMEIVLGIDNVIFLAIVAGRLPKEQQPKARKIGLAAALGTRILLLFSLSFLLGLTRPVLRLPDRPLISSKWSARLRPHAIRNYAGVRTATCNAGSG